MALITEDYGNRVACSECKCKLSRFDLAKYAGQCPHCTPTTKVVNEMALVPEIAGAGYRCRNCGYLSDYYSPRCPACAPAPFSAAGLVPLGTRVLVKQIEADKATEGGILIPESAQERPPEGIIMAVGPKVEGLQVGMRVIFRKWSSKAFTVSGEDGDDLIVMEEDQALAVRRG